jgi:NAD(P)-dependent dehydrogenase (short-subunit alcohol dehydrogenase family)
MKIDGKVFVVTGGASGLGEAACRALVEKGGCVAVFDMNEERGCKLVEELGSKSAFFLCDVTNEESVSAAIDGAAAKFGAIHGNVNCAGGAIPGTIVDRKGKPINMQTFEKVVRLNVIGTVSVMSKCAAKMVENEPDENGERGCVINVASVAAFDGQNGQAAYSASKGGIVGMTLPAARDLGSRGVRFNTIAPGVFDTPPIQDPRSGMKEKDGSLTRVGLSLAGQQVFPNKRFGATPEFAHMACAIFENVMMNGETVRLDAAIRMPKL